MFSKAKLIRKGKCKQCGNCCRQITFKVGDKFLTDEAEFESLKRWQKKYNNFFISGKDLNGTLLFTCKALNADNKCSIHFFRSLYCRLYPLIKSNFFFNGGEVLENCGYYFESSKNFEEFLK